MEKFASCDNQASSGPRTSDPAPAGPSEISARVLNSPQSPPQRRTSSLVTQREKEGKEGRGQQMFKALWGKANWNPEPGGTLGCGLTQVDRWTSFRQFPSSWEKDASERTCVCGYNVCLWMHLCSSCSICLEHLSNSSWKPLVHVSTWQNPRQYSRLSSKVWGGLMPPCLPGRMTPARLFRVFCVTQHWPPDSEQSCVCRLHALTKGRGSTPDLHWTV